MEDRTSNRATDCRASRSKVMGQYMRQHKVLTHENTFVYLGKIGITWIRGRKRLENNFFKGWKHTCFKSKYEKRKTLYLLTSKTVGLQKTSS